MEPTIHFLGRHYETGTLANLLRAMGATNPKTGEPYSEALALGASGGIAFGNFVFEYKGHLPHLALLTRNTFSPFERMLDNLAIRRDSRETTDASRAEKNLRLELDLGNPAIVWADSYSLPYTGLCGDQMWAMRPLLVVGHDGADFLVVDGPARPFRLSAEVLAVARGRVKKDRHRMMVLEAPDSSRLSAGLLSGIETCCGLFLDNPPAGSPNNFGIVGMRHFAKMLIDTKNPKRFSKVFEPGPRLAQALAGRFGQPGILDWIEGWGTDGQGDRATYAGFLEEAAAWTGCGGLKAPAPALRKSAELWGALAEASMPDEIGELKALKDLKRRHRRLWIEKGPESLAERAEIRTQMGELFTAVSDPAKLKDHEAGIRSQMSELVTQIADIEEEAVSAIRASSQG